MGLKSFKKSAKKVRKAQKKSRFLKIKIINKVV